MSKSIFQHVKITGIKTVVPENKISIDDEIEYFENAPKKLARAKKMFGYGTRHIVDAHVTTVDLCFSAAKLLLDEMNIDKNEIDTLLFLSQTSDYKVPASASILHGMLELTEECATLDISQGCSGYVYGLWQASSLIASGASKKVLLLSGDTLSKYSYASNRLINPIFGDSASATLIEYTEQENTSYFLLGSRGSGWDKIIIPAGGSRLPLSKENIKNDIKDAGENVWNVSHIIMKGFDILRFSIDTVPNKINEILNFAHKKKEEIALFVLHQSNKQILESIAAKAEISPEKLPMTTFSEYGNNACNSIPTALTHHLSITTTHKDILLAGYGSGLSWAFAIIHAEELYNGGISLYTTPTDILSREEIQAYWEQEFISKGNND